MSLPNLEAAIAILYELDKQKEADSILELFVKTKPPEFWDPSVHPFLPPNVHPAVAETITTQQEAAAAVTAAAFDLETELVKAAKSYNTEAIKKLAQVPVDDFYKLIKSKEGTKLREIVLSGLEFRRISNATPEMLEVVRRTQEALKKIAAESKLNAIRVGKYGIKLP